VFGGFDPDLDRGRVLSDLAVAVADGATAIDDIRVLRDQGELFGPVASTTTAWRCLDEIDDIQLARIGRARSKVRTRSGPRSPPGTDGSLPRERVTAILARRS
jgi:hypothetical protein